MSALSIRNMNFTMQSMAHVRDDADHREYCKDIFAESLGSLKLACPKWEDWYDDNKNVPAYFKWNLESVKPIIHRMDTLVLHKQMMEEAPVKLVVTN